MVVPEQAVTLTIQPAPRQTFAGFGASLLVFPAGFAALSPERRQLLARLLWHDERIRHARIWLDADQYSPAPGQQNIQPFVDCVVKSDALALARANGVTTFPLTTDHYPRYMAEPQPCADGQTYIRDEQIPVWMGMLADFIARLRDEFGTRFDAAGIINEPGGDKKFSVTQMPTAIKALRRALEAATCKPSRRTRRRWRP